MYPIISGTEILIPLTYGDKYNREVAPRPAVPRPQVPRPAAVAVPQLPRPAAVAVPPQLPRPAAIDVWAAIARLNWVDRDDDQYPTLNPRRPSQHWTQVEWVSVGTAAVPLYNRMIAYLDGQNFWFKNDVQDKEVFVWHCIGRGRQVYDAVMNDSSFACGYIGQECGFDTFIANWS